MYVAIVIGFLVTWLLQLFCLALLGKIAKLLEELTAPPPRPLRGQGLYDTRTR